MPKKFLVPSLVTTIVFVILVVFLFNHQNSENRIENSPTIPPDITQEPSKTIEKNNFILNGDFTVSWVIIRNTEKIELYENFTEKLSSKDAKQEYNCDHLTNGGFYGEDNKPLGLLVVNGILINNSKESQLFNAYFAIDKDDKFSISRTKPQISRVNYALQSGPMLILNSLPQKLTIETDENARRIIAAETPKNEAVFMVIYSKTSPLMGPKLAELPKILDDVQKNTNLNFKNAINLDGGSHSTFISGSLGLSELARVGTFICVKP